MAVPPPAVAPPSIVQAQAEDLPDVRELLREYAAGLDFSLAFQDFERELDGLPGSYAPPAGALLVARDGETAAGCVALRPLGDATCELNRLFVRPAWRGSGLGARLVIAIMDEGRRLGYARMRLDTVPGMEAAQALYARLGFRVIDPYTENPVAGTAFLELDL